MEDNKNQNLEISRDFSVPKDQLYNAWINPDQLKQWWRPLNNNLVEVSNDVKTNGQVKYVFKTEDNQESFNITGEYLDVKEGERLEYTWNWKSEHRVIDNGDYKLTIEFIQKGEGNSTLKVKQDSFISEESIMPHREGWEKALNDLSQFLSSALPNNISDNSNSGSQGNTESNNKGTESRNNNDVTGYNEIAEQEKVGGYSS